jgi:hypothetical protein
MGSFIWGIEAAVNNAAHLGAVKGDQLVLTAISNNAGSTSADGEAVGKTSVVSNIAAMTFHGDVITSAIFDSVQAGAEFGTDGVVATEAGAVASKNQLGENYGLKAYSPIGKEWNEQVAAFAEYITGKTAEEVAGTALTETTAPAEADLTSSVTIAVSDFMSLVEKAAAIAESMKTPVKTGYALTTNLTVESATAEADGSATTDVSLIAVTVYSSSVISTTVKQTPLCATLWSIFNSPTKEQVNVKCKLPCSRTSLRTVANSSTIPENITLSIYIVIYNFLLRR